MSQVSEISSVKEDKILFCYTVTLNPSVVVPISLAAVYRFVDIQMTEPLILAVELLYKLSFKPRNGMSVHGICMFPRLGVPNKIFFPTIHHYNSIMSPQSQLKG